METAFNANEVLSQLEPAHLIAYNISLYSYTEQKKIAGDIKITESKSSQAVIEGPGGINDKRMGALSLTEKCITCSGQNCPGHPGIIEFGEKNEIINPLFKRTIIRILNCICHSCSRVLFCNELDGNAMSDKLQKILKKSPDQEGRLIALEDYVKKITECTCDYSSKNCNIEKCKPHINLKIANITDNGIIVYEVESKKKGDKEKTKVTLYTYKVKSILKNITDSDAKYLGFIGDTKPVDLIMQAIMVMPPLARSPITDKNGDTIQNPITTLYLDVVKAITNKDNAPGKIYRAVYNLLVKNQNFKRSGQEIKTISELMLGKKGIFRMSTMGKRVDWACRTVADPGQHLAYGQVALPLEFSFILSKPRYVTNFNVDFLNKLLRQKKINHIIDKEGVRRPPRYDDPNGLETLVVGQLVEIQLREKDRVYMNRQPTLHKGSMQSFEIVLEPDQVIKSHLSSTTNFNLDHDGDELNVWIPRDFFVEAENEYIMNAKQCIISSASGKTAAGLVMNSVTAIHLLSMADAEVDLDVFTDMQEVLTDKSALPTLSERMNKFGINMTRVSPKGDIRVTGRAVISMLLPIDLDVTISDIQIRSGIFLTGSFNKGKAGQLIKKLAKNYGLDRTATFLTDAPHVLNIYIINRGFTVSIDDCQNRIVDSNAEFVNKKYNKKVRELEKQQKLLQNLVFSSKTWDTLPDIMDKVIKYTSKTLVDNWSKDRLAEVIVLLQREVVGYASGYNRLKELFTDFLSNKKFAKEIFKAKLDEVEDNLAHVKKVSDPFIMKLRKDLNDIQLGYLLTGQQLDMTEINTKISKLSIASYEELINTILYNMISHLRSLRKKRKRVNREDVDYLIRLDELLRNYKHDLNSYLAFKALENDILKIKDNSDAVVQLLSGLEKSKSLQFILNLEYSEITEEYPQINVNQDVENYKDEMKEFIDEVIDILKSNALDVSFKQATIGVINELLLYINGLTFKNFKKEASKSYNRNYVVKKEEMAKMLLEIKAIGTKEGLTPQEAEFKEIQLMEKLNFAKVIGTKLAKEVPKSNAIVLQTEEGAGTKGSSTNVGQIMGSVGQQYMSGKRLWHGYPRLSSHYDEKDESPEARGLVTSSFLEGLTPTEMFFIQAAGRENVIETYMMTPLCGKLQRFMEISLTNMIIAYDGSVRNNLGFLYSTSYNNGFDISRSIAAPTIDKPSLMNFINLKDLIDEENHKRGWYTKSEAKKLGLRGRKASLAVEFARMLEEPTVIEIVVQGINLNHKMTLFEKARMIGVRAEMLNQNDKPRVPIGDLVEAMDIAKLEYSMGALAEDPALVIIRTLPNGSTVTVLPTLENII